MVLPSLIRGASKTVPENYIIRKSLFASFRDRPQELYKGGNSSRAMLFISVEQCHATAPV
jgi:hypothetical protein